MTRERDINRNKGSDKRKGHKQKQNTREGKINREKKGPQKKIREKRRRKMEKADKRMENKIECTNDRQTRGDSSRYF